MRKSRAISVLVLACIPWAYADESLEQASVYLPADFSQYAPLTARDMVERIPGFRLEDSRGDDESRGLGQATENVLINGQRISSKSASAADVLQRIPAATVERIELVEGASLDIPGLSGLVVNVVAEADGVTGTWTYQARFTDGQKPRYLGGELSLAGQGQTLGWSVNLSAEPRGSAGQGEELFRDGFGQVLETRQLDQSGLFPLIEGGVGLRWTPMSGLVANANVDFVSDEREQREIAVRQPTGGPDFRQRLVESDDTNTVELSGDVAFDAFAGRAKLIGLYADTKNPETVTLARTELDGTPLEDSFFRQIRDETELIFRGEYEWSAAQGSWVASLETALNSLDSSARLLESTGGAALSAVDLGETDVEVDEQRAEGFLTYSRSIGERLQMQFSLGAEISELESSGSTGQTRTFTRPKGSVTLSWLHNDRTTFNARLNRRVGQLDFFDFISRVDLNDGENQAGNADIVPEQAWRGELEVERQFGPWGAGSALIFAEALEDVVDQIPIGAGEGPGNLDRGSRIGLEIEGTLNLDPAGLDGAQFVYSAIFQDSAIEDPLTGEDRAINGEEQVEIDLEFRHDIAGTDYAWGVEYAPELVTDTFRIDSIRSDRDQPGRIRVFLEHKDLWGLTARAELARPFNDIEKQNRQRFDPDRTGALIETERSRVEETPFLSVEIGGSF